MEALKALTDEKLLDHVRNNGRYALLKLNGFKQNSPFVKEVRGLGFMFGVELGGPCANVVAECAQKGLLVNCAGEKVIRLLPPLTVTRDELDRGLGILGKVLGA
jgi:acetylornithine/succinyldiaminopimelate/putrescine aminotransferase